MRNMFVVLLLSALTSLGHADVPATAFFVLESPTLKRLVADKPLAEIADEKLAEAALASGRVIEGSANFFVSTKQHTLSVRLESWQLLEEPGRPFRYHISLWERDAKKAVFSLSGRATQNGKQSVTENWQQEKYVVVFRFLNLKK